MVSAQSSSPWICGDDKIIELQKDLSPEYNKNLLKYNLQLREYLKYSAGKKSGKNFKIQGNTGIRRRQRLYYSGGSSCSTSGWRSLWHRNQYQLYANTIAA